MTKERADLGFGNALEAFDPADWSPAKLKTAKERPKREDTAKAAEGAGFRSREPKASSAAEPAAQNAAGQGAQRRRRTGRNMQFNLKARRETIEAYCAIADAQGWGLGETLEHAVKLLEAKYRAGRKAAS